MSTQEPSNKSAKTWEGSRLQGVVILVLGLLAGYFAIVLPLQEAYSHTPEISMYFKFAFLSPALILLGILAIIFPSLTTNQTFLLKSHNKLSVAGWALVVALAVLGFGTYYLLDLQISLLGYSGTTFGK
jgi:hypothetical protein